MRFTLEEIKREMDQNPPKPSAGRIISGYICYYIQKISGAIGYAFTPTHEESLQNPKELRFMPGQTVEISDPNLIIGNISVKAYLEKWLADYDALIEECDKQCEKETRVEALEKEVGVLKKALAETLDLLQSIGRAR